MKLKMFILIIGLFACNSLFSADKYENVRYSMLWDNLIKHGITKMKVTEIEYEFGVPQNYGFIKKDYIFDNNMNVIESKYYKKEDYKGKYLYEYNANMDTVKITQLNADNEELYRTGFSYDPNGYLIEKNCYDEKELDYKEVYTNDSEGRMLEMQKFIAGKLDLGFKYKYNTAGEEVEFERINEENVRDMQGISKFNDKGIKVDSTYFFEELEDLKVEFSYDKNNRLIERKYTSPKVGLLERYTFKYNPKGQLIEEKRFDDQDVMVEMYILSYEEDGQIEKIEIYEENEFLTSSWRFNYHLNGLLKDEHFYNKLDIPQFLRQYDYEPVQGE